MKKGSSTLLKVFSTKNITTRTAMEKKILITRSKVNGFSKFSIILA